jgi:cytochrome P450
VRQRLESEILSSFTSYDDINATTAASLKYLHATCQEALRIFPPLPLGLPREVPKGGASVDGFWVPGGVCVHLAHDQPDDSDVSFAGSLLTP